MNTIETARKNILNNLSMMIREMIEQYALWGNKHFAMLLYNRAKGLHSALKIANGFNTTFLLMHYIEDEARILHNEKTLDYEDFNARKFVEEMEALSDNIIDMD